MLSIAEAFGKFKTRLEITPGEQGEAARRHRDVRDTLRAKMAIDRDFLTGSYDRDTKTKPLKDIDVFIVLSDATRDDLPSTYLAEMKGILDDKYGPDCVTIDPPAVRVDFGGDPDDDRVLSIEVVPAIAEGKDYAIPDPTRTSWMSTNPERHAELVTAANLGFDARWVPLVKMLKKWNDHQGEPVVPSFLIEVMALRLVIPPWGSSYAREVKMFFASGAETIGEVWPDPAGLGSPVSDLLAVDTQLLSQARTALRDAEARASEAIRLDQQGKAGAALEVWQDLFGPRFSKS